jgi:hypothetical protein
MTIIRELGDTLRACLFSFGLYAAPIGLTVVICAAIILMGQP